MDKLKDNSNHVVPYILQKEMKKKMEIKFHENMVKITERHGEEIIKAVNRGEKDGIKKGKKEGKKEEKLEIAKSLLTMVMKHEEISKATGLSMEEINSLTKK
jgi:predicted transposase/invertase (TIGR01784 family)